ncbi:MAG TPA: hypothetical protein VJN88_03855 [Ktedonobacterales bacterium]|nr:hypothetical protein [Ktedonobacterales bacterium]
MTRVLHILMLVALVAAGAAACKNSDNTLKNPNSTYDPSQDMGSPSVTQ